jgi:ribosome recycling factor
MANIHADFEKLMAEQTAFMDNTISQLPTPKKKSYMGNNIVILDYAKQTWSTAITAIASLDTTQMRITTYPTKNRIAIIF